MIFTYKKLFNILILLAFASVVNAAKLETFSGSFMNQLYLNISNEKCNQAINQIIEIPSIMDEVLSIENNGEKISFSIKAYINDTGKCQEELTAAMGDIDKAIASAVAAQEKQRQKFCNDVNSDKNIVAIIALINGVTFSFWNPSIQKEVAKLACEDLEMGIMVSTELKKIAAENEQISSPHQGNNNALHE